MRLAPHAPASHDPLDLLDLPMNEDKATRYHRLTRRAAVGSLALSGALLAGLVVTGASHALRETAAALADLAAATDWVRRPAEAVFFALLLGVLMELLLLPPAFYRGFLLERRYNLSAETATMWLRDYFKASALGLALAVLGASVVYASISAWPAGWWILAAAVFSAATVVLTNLTPVLLLPLFYRLTPLDREPLRTRLQALARRAGIPALEAYEWKLGKKSRKANAALVGTGGTRRVLLSDTLLAEYTDDEIDVVFAHELAHHVHGDIWKGVLFETALTFAGFFCADRLLRALGPAAGLRGADDVAGLPLLVLAGGVLSALAVPIANAVSRRLERRADRFALALTGQPGAFVSAMRRLGAQNLAEERPSWLVEILFYTHPPLGRRIEEANTIAE